MDFREDTSGQAIQIGALLLFATLIIAFASYQSYFVPQQNSEVEFNAYEESRQDMIDLRDAIVTSGTRGIGTITTIKTGATYPERLVAVNPPSPSGGVATGAPRNVTIGNIRAVESESENTRSYWNVSGTRLFENVTKGIRYRPDFNQITVPPITVTGETAFGEGDQNPVRLGNQLLLSGNRLRMIFIRGNLSASGQSASVFTQPESIGSRTVTVTGQSDPLTIEFEPPPGLTADQWVSSYGGEMLNSNDRVNAVSNQSGNVLVELNGTRIYQLQLASVRVDDQELDPGNQDSKYIIAHEGNDQSIVSGQRAQVVSEVRDKFDNPVGDADVQFEVTQGDARLLDAEGEPVSGTRTVSTNSEGRVPMELITESADNNVIVNASIVNKNGNLASTEFEIQISQAPGQSEGAGAYLISVVNAEAASPDGSGKGLRFTIENEDDNRDMTITRYAVERVTTEMSRFDRDSQASSLWQYPLTIDVGNTGSPDGYLDTNQLSVGSTDSLTQQATVGPGEQAVFRNWESSQPGQNMEGDFVQVTIYFEMEGSNEEISATTTLFLF